jgi:hypothetical protein
MSRLLFCFLLLIIILILINNKIYENYVPLSNNTNCCLIYNEYVQDDTNEMGGSFKYKYEKTNNCNTDNIYNNNKQILTDGENGWSNESCNDSNKTLGSCRNINKECIDFVDKTFCDKYHMEWSTKTCRDPLEYVWKDRIIINKPIPKSDNEFIMFKKF